MNLLKKSELLLLKEQNLLPAIPMPGFPISQRQQKNALQRKQSDFIKRLKKTKSIMLAQKNRKQKNILNPYYMDNRKKKGNELVTIKSHSNSSIISSPKNETTVYKYDMLEKILFPPVHSSVQNNLSPYKKWKNREFRRQTLINEPIDIGTYLQDKTQNKKNKSFNYTEEIEPKQSKDKLEEELKLIESERENKNKTESRENKMQNIYKSEKRLNHARSYFEQKIKKKLLKLYKHPTQQREVEVLGGWDIRNLQQEHLVLERQQF